MNGNVLRAEADNGIEQASQRAPFATADIVNLTAAPSFEKHPVRSHDIPHIGEIAHDVQVANLDHTSPPAVLYRSHLPAKTGQDESRGLARPRMIERSSGEHIATKAYGIKTGYPLLSDFGNPIRAVSRNRARLRQWLIGELILFT